MAVSRFGAWLRQMMRECGIPNQADLAERLGVVPSTVSNWVAGTSEPDTERVEALARTFGVSVARVYEALGRMRHVSDAEYRDWVEMLDSTDPEARERILEYARWVVAKHKRLEAEQRAREGQ
jgi:transcriptional regulator with XRE-family HTH domain